MWVPLSTSPAEFLHSSKWCLFRLFLPLVVLWSSHMTLGFSYCLRQTPVAENLLEEPKKEVGSSGELHRLCQSTSTSWQELVSLITHEYWHGYQLVAYDDDYNKGSEKRELTSKNFEGALSFVTFIIKPCHWNWLHTPFVGCISSQPSVSAKHLVCRYTHCHIILVKPGR